MIYLDLACIAACICSFRLAQKGRGRRWVWLIAASAAGAVSLFLAFLDWETRKFVTALAMPAGLVWMGMIALVAFLFSRRLRVPAVLASALLALYSLAGNSYAGNALLGALEARTPDPDQAAAGVLDAVFVMGGGSGLTAEGKAELAAAGDRIAEAARWFHAGKALRLVASGASIAALDGARDFAEETRRLWAGMGVPESAVLAIPEAARNSRQEIQAYKRFVDARGFARVGLVTSAWHMPRALALAKAAGLEALPIPADRRYRPAPFTPVNLVPQADGFMGVQLSIKELLGGLLGS
jgi:uncharacterized SAM-binding protein YcdF (DUF218 family)